MRCEWAGCTRTDTQLVAEWLMCPEHKDEHERLSKPEESLSAEDRIRECHAFGMTDQEIGGLVGMAKDTVARHRRRLGLPGQRVVSRAEHGTTARYQAHLRAGERPCGACRRADAEAVAERKQRRRDHPPARGGGVTPRHVVMFSSGAGSWAAARRVADEHGTDGLVLLFSDVTMEDEDNYRFLHEAAADIGGELVIVRDGRDIWQVFKDDAFLGNSRLANCSKYLKQKPARAWLDEHCDPETTIVYVGIDWSEQHRLPAVVRNYQPFTAKAPLCEAPYVDKAAVLSDLRARGIAPPRLYDLGFAHANCGGGCVRAGQGQFAHLLKALPERFTWWEEQEQDLRDHLGKDVSILRDRRGGTTVPLTLRAFRERHEAEPEQTDLFDIGGCGCFVEGDAA